MNRVTRTHTATNRHLTTVSATRVRHEELVDAEVDPGQVLDEGQPTDHEREPGEEGDRPSAAVLAWGGPADDGEGAPQTQETQGGVELHGRPAAAEAQERLDAQRPPDEDDRCGRHHGKARRPRRPATAHVNAGAQGIRPWIFQTPMCSS